MSLLLNEIDAPFENPTTIFLSNPHEIAVIEGISSVNHSIMLISHTNEKSEVFNIFIIPLFVAIAMIEPRSDSRFQSVWIISSSELYVVVTNPVCQL